MGLGDIRRAMSDAYQQLRWTVNRTGVGVWRDPKGRFARPPRAEDYFAGRKDFSYTDYIPPTYDDYDYDYFEEEDIYGTADLPDRYTLRELSATEDINIKLAFGKSYLPGLFAFDALVSGSGRDRSGDAIKEGFEQTYEYITQTVVPRMFEQGDKDRSMWPALAPRTQQDRVKLGYGKEHPILIRTGDLKDSAMHPGYTIEVDENGTSYMDMFNRNEKLMPEWWTHMQGGSPSDVPVRRFFPTSEDDFTEEELDELKKIWENIFYNLSMGE